MFLWHCANAASICRIQCNDPKVSTSASLLGLLLDPVSCLGMGVSGSSFSGVTLPFWRGAKTTQSVKVREGSVKKNVKGNN